MKIKKCMSSLSDMIKRKCCVVFIEDDMDVDHLVIQAPRFEKEKNLKNDLE